MSDDVSLTSNNINLLIYSYLQETGQSLTSGSDKNFTLVHYVKGLTHSSFTFLQESRLQDATIKHKKLLDFTVSPNLLIRLLHKGLLYAQAEALWKGEKATSLLELDFKDGLPLIVQEEVSSTYENAGTQTNIPLVQSSSRLAQSIQERLPAQNVINQESDEEPVQTYKEFQIPNGIHSPIPIPLNDNNSPKELQIQASTSSLGQEKQTMDIDIDLSAQIQAAVDEHPASRPTSPAIDLRQPSFPFPTDTLQLAGHKRKERASPSPSILQSGMNMPSPRTHSAPMSRKASANSTNGVSFHPSASTSMQSRSASEDREIKRVKLEPETLETLDNAINYLKRPISPLPALLPTSSSLAVATLSSSAATPAFTQNAASVQATTTIPPPITRPETINLPPAAIPSKLLDPTPSPSYSRPSLPVVSVRTVAAPRPPEAPARQERRSSSPNVARNTSTSQAQSSARSASVGARATSPEAVITKKVVSTSTKERARAVKKEPSEQVQEVLKPIGKDPVFGRVSELQIITLKGHTQSVRKLCS